MNPKTLYLFPDTNLFVQCLSLDQVDWSVLGSFDEIHLLVSRPVQLEIDNQQNKGADRLGRRARATSSLFREVILDPLGYKVVKEGKPLVKLLIRQALRPSAGLADQLDYQEPDDRLVGTAHAFVQQNSDLDVRVLTHDTGPMASAQMVGVAVVPIPDEWLLPPESSSAEKKVKTLESEIALLKKAEPAFKVECLDEKGKNADTLKFDVARYEPLAERELIALMSRIVEKFPLATEFGPREPSERQAKHVGGFNLREVFTPATDNEIAAYREKYPRWLKKCAEKLRAFHDILQRRDDVPVFNFAIINEGTRPGKDVLVTIEAKGEFMILPQLGRDLSEEDQPKESLELPAPPSVPCGVWKPIGFLGTINTLAGFREPLSATIAQGVPAFFPHVPQRHDPNALYYKPNRPSAPTSMFELECEQWRHGIGPKFFLGEIHVGKEDGSVKGLLECRMHAENLSHATAKQVVVKIRIKRTQIYNSAKNAVDRL